MQLKLELRSYPKKAIHNLILFPLLLKKEENKTKIYVSHDNESGNRIEDCNIIAPKDTLLKFENKKNIYFDLWNAKDVEMSINNKPISRYIKNENVLVRGSFEPIKKELYLEFYSH